MGVKEETFELLQRLVSDDNVELPAGATESLLDDFEQGNNVSLSPALREWLLVCNGASLSIGNVFGIGITVDFLNIEYVWSLHPNWRDRGLMPLADDGCGDYYVVDLKRKIRSECPVYFIDQADLTEPRYIMASNVWHFFRALFLSEIERAPETLEYYWPFEEERVLKEDAALREYEGLVPFAWNVE